MIFWVTDFVFPALLLCSSVYLLKLFSPYWIVVLLVTQTCICSLYLASLSLFWFSYMLFLVILGGLLVIFSYLTSLLSYEEMDSAGGSYLMISMSMAGLVLILGSFFNMFSFSQSSVSSESIFSVHSLILPVSGKMYCLIIFYLLLSLICVVNITKSKEGPLRLNV
uniref:NADH dehydrogenase subunit 6 n=1 Tax=Sphaeroma terebrans TaxID=180402 RepID=A0A5J6NHX5_SPHTE|nr:NADH dehydrogenase subunit 6 [Sphaeroma terebrans]